jgi:hypothetical protein
MPRHQHVNTCLKGGGPISKFCTCPHCLLCVCEVCGAYEGGLTTDCPGAKIDFDRQKEIHETSLNYTDARGWHLGDPTEPRTPRFTDTRLSPAPPPVDPRTLVAPGIDWAAVDRTSGLQHALSQKAIAWVLADRACDAQSARLAQVEAQAAPLREKQDHGGALMIKIGPKPERALLATLEGEKINFQLACRRVEQCEDELKQAARSLVAALEEHRPAWWDRARGDQ